MRGSVTEIIIDRGFGFIQGEDGQTYFFHRNALTDTDFGELGPGVAVEFGIQTGEHGDRQDERPRAVNVRLAPDAIPASDHEVLPPGKIR